MQSETKMKQMRDQVFSHMLETRGKKYKNFLLALKAFKYLSLNPTKGTFLESYYALMRYVDDFVDGDAKLPLRFNSSVEFVEEKIEFAKTVMNPQDSVDYLMIYCFELAEKFGEDFSNETQSILSSMLFDAKRHGKRIIFPEDKLAYHFHLLDIEGTTKATLKVFGENLPRKNILESKEEILIRKSNLLEPLGLASRFYFDIRDLPDDFCEGLINLSLEDATRLGINDTTIVNTQRISKEYIINKSPLEKRLQQLPFYRISEKNEIKDQLELLWGGWYERLPSNIVDWTKEHATRVQDNLEIHKQQNLTQFGLLARLAFPVVYESPASKFSNKILTYK